MSNATFAKEALGAYEIVYSILAKKLNEHLLCKIRRTLRIKAAAPPENLPLDIAIARFKRWLDKAQLPEIVGEPDVAPWSLGYLNGRGEHDKPIWVYATGGCHWTEGTLEQQLSHFADCRSNWKRPKWKTNIVVPVEDHAKAWRKLLKRYAEDSMEPSRRPFNPEVVLANACRDEWLYAQLTQKERGGALIKQEVVLARLHQECSKRGWSDLKAIKSAKNAANRWAKRNGKDPIPKRAQGRPPRRTR